MDMYLYILLITLRVSSGSCYAEYSMFRGFDENEWFKDDSEERQRVELEDHVASITSEVPKGTHTNSKTPFDDLNPTIEIDGLNRTTGFKNSNPKIRIGVSNATVQLKQPPIPPLLKDQLNNSSMMPTMTIYRTKFDCPEKEDPINIGPYVVPSQRDLVFFIKKSLVLMFNSYHKKALNFLRDIKQAALAALKSKHKCHGKSKELYHKCVKKVKAKCATITKDLVIALEIQRQNVANFSEKSICNIEEIKNDPIELIKTLAMERVSLEFALPGFLRLLSSCTSFCDLKFPKFTVDRKPERHMTDTDLLVKHILTKKNYLELLQGTT